MYSRPAYRGIGLKWHQKTAVLVMSVPTYDVPDLKQ